MTSIGRLTAQLGITLVLAAALSFALPGFVDHPDYARAVANYAMNPSPDNEQILRLESVRNQQAQLKMHIAVTGLFFLGLNAVWFSVARWSGKSSKSP